MYQQSLILFLLSFLKTIRGVILHHVVCPGYNLGLTLLLKPDGGVATQINALPLFSSPRASSNICEAEILHIYPKHTQRTEAG